MHRMQPVLCLTAITNPDLSGLANGSPQHIQMTIGDVALELLKGDKARRFNALPMASSGVHVGSDLHVYVHT